MPAPPSAQHDRPGSPAADEGSEPQGAAALHSALSRRDVAPLVGVSWKTLAWLLYRRGTDRYYNTWLIKKKSGGTREIRAPKSTLYRVQSSLHEILQNSYQPRPAAHGFVRGRSVVTNARPHVNRRFVLTVDIADFFPSINFGRVRGLFLARPFECTPEVATILAQICCSDGSLPIGAPTSPVIANMICLRLDRELQNLARQRGCWYSRYADDLTFSTNRTAFPHALAQVDDSGNIVLGDELVRIIEANGFSHNTSKTRLQTRDDRQVVTGVIVNERLNVDRRYVRRIRAMIHAWDHYGLEAAQGHVAKWDSKDRFPGAAPTFLRILAGRISYLAMIRDPSDAIVRRFTAQYENLKAGRPLNDGIVHDLSPGGSPATSSQDLDPDSTKVSVLAAEVPSDFIERWRGRTSPVATTVLHAIELFGRATDEDVRSAVIELAGVLEERRSPLKRELVKGDEADLFNIANNFAIRHRKADQKTDYRPEFLRWLFWWYLHTVDLSERIIGSSESSGT